jgi:hypothetical protein
MAIEITSLSLVSVPNFCNRYDHVRPVSNWSLTYPIILFRVTVATDAHTWSSRRQSDYLTDGERRYWVYTEGCYLSCLPPPKAVRDKIGQALKEVANG